MYYSRFSLQKSNMVYKLNIKSVFESLGTSQEEQDAILKMMNNLMEKTAHLNKPGDIKVDLL